MANLATTKMSSKGQVVIPEGIRKRLGLKAGAQFVVVGDKDVVILKAISPPSMEDFDTLISEANKQARKAGMKRSDIADAIAKVRSKNWRPCLIRTYSLDKHLLRVSGYKGIKVLRPRKFVDEHLDKL
jgi:AbrB family looped-hinge helix DNA binding protein